VGAGAMGRRGGFRYPADGKWSACVSASADGAGACPARRRGRGRVVVSHGPAAMSSRLSPAGVTNLIHLAQDLARICAKAQERGIAGMVKEVSAWRLLGR